MPSWKALVLLAGVAIPSSATAESWVYESEDVEVRALSRLRFAPRLNFWFSEYDRPSRACAFTSFGPPIEEVRPEGFAVRRSAQFACNNDASDEFGFGPGFEVSFHALGPLYVSAALDVIYTAPSSDFIKNQVILTLPFSATLTWYPWLLRPIATVTIAPVLYVTDDARDYTLGAAGGGAYRLLDWGDLSLTIGYQGAGSMKTWQMLLGLHPIL